MGNHSLNLPSHLNNSTGSLSLLCLNNSTDCSLNLRLESLSPSHSRPDPKLPDSLFLRDNHPSPSSKLQVTFSKTLSSLSQLRSPPTRMEPLSHMKPFWD